jgi:hypothetical protein
MPIRELCLQRFHSSLLVSFIEIALSFCGSVETPLDCEGLRGSLRPTAGQYAAPKIKPLERLEKKTLLPAENTGIISLLKDVVKDAVKELVDSTNPMRKSYYGEVEEHRKTSSHRLHMQWANVVAPATSFPIVIPTHQEQEFPHIDRDSAKLVVTELYPRLLYTFSDVVCYVTTNLK